jgi:hypothetical protein
VDDSAPVAFQHVSWDVNNESQSEARNVHAIDFAFVEMVRQRGITSAAIRVDADPAWTEHFTVADFKQTSFEFIGHI